jgi:regulator of protease activity HflC (stomatin/prohibitin superfamily)
VDPKRAALDVADYQSAIGWASQTALRDVIGKTMLSDMLEGRDKISNLLRKIIDERTEPWGINVISVEVKDVLIPTGLEDAMSMQAQAERERQARVILGDAERQIAEKFAEAGKMYEGNPVAFHLRAMNMLYEGLKENSTIVIVPSTAVESMQLGGLAGMTALSMGLGQEPPNRLPSLPSRPPEQINGHRDGTTRNEQTAPILAKATTDGDNHDGLKQAVERAGA